MKRTSLIIVFFISLSVVLGFWVYTKANGEEITVCVRRNGLMYVVGEGFRRGECRRSETLLSWDKQGTSGPQGEKGDKGDVGEQGEDGQDGNELHLVDGSGNDLGIYLDFSAEGREQHTYSPTIDALIHFAVQNRTSGQTIEINPTRKMLYTQIDCQGTPYINSPIAPNILWRGYVANRFFVAETIAPLPATVTVSELDVGGCVNRNAGPHDIFSLQEVTLPFPYPPTWPLEVRSL